MSQTYLTPAQYVDELNRELKSQPQYEDGMAFVLTPKGCDPAQASGYEITGPWEKIVAYADAAHEVRKRFDIAD